MVSELDENVNLSIVLVRGRKVMLSQHLAALYGVDAKILVQAVKRNIERFPDDFMFQITTEEFEFLRSQIVTLEKKGRGHYPKYLPYAFTQEGIAMLSSVLRSPRAIQANIAIMRTFVKLRELMISHRDLAQRIDALESKYNAQFKVVFNSIKEIINAKAKDLPQVPSKRRIGF